MIKEDYGVKAKPITAWEIHKQMQLWKEFTK
jgi:hypothetical protein